jgi:hypothetical protein
MIVGKGIVAHDQDNSPDNRHFILVIYWFFEGGGRGGEEYIINIRYGVSADVGNQKKEKCSLDWLVARNYSVLRTGFINTYRRQFRESLLQCGGAVGAAAGGRYSGKEDRGGRVKTS